MNDEVHAAKTQTRKEHHDECVAAANPATHPIPELVTSTTIVGRDAAGNKLLARDEDVNETDVRDWDETTKSWGPWRRAKG